MQSIWNGGLSFGLVNIPVRLYAATKSETLGFKLLCGTCNTPLSYKRICSTCKKEIPYEDVVKGLKLKDGSYFIATPEKVQELKPERTEQIEIVSFVPKDTVDYIYLDNHYFLAPQHKKESAYFLFKKALEQTEKVAIGQFVMRDKQYVCVINPYQEGLLLTTMHYAYELRAPSTIATLKEKAKVSTKEVELAKKLIAQRSKKTLDISGFKDTFAVKLKAAIAKQKKTKKVPEKTTPRKRQKREKPETLLENLRASLKSPGKKTQRPVARAQARQRVRKKT